MDKWHSMFANTHYTHGYKVLALIWTKSGLNEFWNNAFQLLKDPSITDYVVIHSQCFNVSKFEGHTPSVQQFGSIFHRGWTHFYVKVFSKLIHLE